MGLIWQPRVDLRDSCTEFSIEVDKEFARIMGDSKIDKQKKRRMQELGVGRVKVLGYSYPEPYSFFEDSAFVTGFYLGSNGVWLAMDSEWKDMKFEINPVYCSHNCDTSRDALGLMQLVSLWVEYADLLRE